MVSVINKKTKQPHQFSDEDWQTAISKGLHTKFKVVEQTTELSKSTTKNFTPPELKEKVVETEEKKVNKKKNTAG